jgi:hypothetical protein
MPVGNYLGADWTSAKGVLSHLHRNASTRCLVRRVSEVVLTTRWNTTLLTHPLLNPLIHLESYYSNEEFVGIIGERLKKE